MANKNRSTGVLHEMTVYKNTAGSFAPIAGPTNFVNTQNTISRSFTGNFFTIDATTGTPQLLVYTNNGNDTFTDITANIDTNVTQNAYSASWSPGDTQLAVGLGTSPFIAFFSRSGNNLTRLAAPATIPTFSVQCIEFSPDGNYVAGAGSSATIVYKNNLDGTFTSLGALPSQPTSSLVYGCTWSADGKYLVMVSSSSPYLHIYKRTGDTFAKLTNPTIPANGLASARFSPNGTYLALGSSGVSTNTILILKNNNNDTFTLLTNPVTPNATYITQDTLSWSQDSQLLSAGFNVPGFAAGTSSPIRIYKNNGDDTFSIQADITY
jgi:WD40 repeat protein